MKFQKMQTGSKARFKELLARNYQRQEAEDSHKKKMLAMGAINPKLLKKK